MMNVLARSAVRPFSASANMLNLLIITVVTIGMVQTGEVLHCYACNSVMDEKCGDPVDVKSIGGMNCYNLTEDLPHRNNRKKMLLNHTDDYIYGCQKIKISDLQGRKLTMRACSIVRNKRANKFSCNLNDSIISLTGGQGTVDYCGVCYTDYCNAGCQTGETHGLLLSVMLSLPTVVIWSWLPFST
ncbi:hypothetical protein C0J52_03032 [Blattella germanica]|nr:hypothetical protein C0J52_03032 [Blattella germanica]